MQSPDPQRPQSPLKWISFVAITIAIGTSLMFAPPLIQSILFLLILFVSLTLSIQQLLIGAIKFGKFIQQKHQQYPLLHARASFVVALFLIGLATNFYQARYIEFNTGFYLFILSFPFVVISLRLLPQPIIPAASDTTSPARIHWHWIVVSMISMVLLTMMNVPSLWRGRPHNALGLVGVSPHVQMLALTIGIITLLMGFGVRLLPRRIAWQRHHWTLAGIIMLAAFMRLWDLEHALRFFVDEILFVISVNEYDIADNTMKILLPQANSFSDVFSFFQYAVKQIIGPGLSALRIPSAIFGILGVVGVYALARQLFSLRVAIISTLLVAVMPIYVHYSRIGLNNIAGTTIAIWMFVYLLRGMRHQRLTDYAIAGTLLGLIHYFHEGERLFVTPFLFCWIVWVALIGRKSSTFHFPTIKHLFVLVFTCLVIVVPFYHTLISHGHQLAERFTIRHDPNLTPETHLNNILFHSHVADLGYPIVRYIQIEMDGLYYQSQDAFVLPMLAPFFLIGFAYLLWHIRTHGGALLLWWAVGVAVGNSLIIQNFSAISARFVVVYPILMMIVAVGISVTWSMLVTWVGKRFEKFIQVGFVVFLVVTAAYSSHYYFNDTVPNFRNFVFTRLDFAGNYRPAVDDMILRALVLPPNTDVHIFTDTLLTTYYKNDIPFYYERNKNEFMVHNQRIQRLADEYFLNLPRDRNYVFVTTRDHDYILNDIERYFTITKVEGSPWNIPEAVEMIMYHAPLEANQTLPDGSPLPDMPINTQVRMR